MVIKIKLVVVEYRVLIISTPRSCYYSWERTPERTVAQRGVRESHGGKIIRKLSLTEMKTRKIQNIRFLASKPRSVLFISLVFFFFERVSIYCLEDFRRSDCMIELPFKATGSRAEKGTEERRKWPTYLVFGTHPSPPRDKHDRLLQWYLDITKCQGNGEICSLYRGFVISNTSI